MAQTLAQLDAVIAQNKTDVLALTTMTAANSVAIKALTDKITSLGNQDFTAEVNEVLATDQAVKDATTAIGTADAPPAS